MSAATTSPSPATTATQTSSRSALGLAALCAGMGVAHFLVPRLFDEIVPDSVPGSARWWTLASGVAEIGIGAALAVPATRRAGAAAAGALFVGVWPANWNMAWQWRGRPAWQQAIAIGRLPLQVPLILQADRAARGA